MKSTSNVKITRDLKAPEAVGVHHRLLCMTGKNKGLSYYIKAKRVVLGRGETVDVQVLDNKSSREHAELTIHGGKYILTDLGSQNGVTVNDLKVNQHTLEDGDRVIIGQSVFKYNILKVEPDLTLIEADDEDSGEVTEYEDNPTEKKKARKKKPADEDQNKRKKIIYAVVGLFVLFLIFGDGDQEKQDSGEKEQKRNRLDPSLRVQPGDTGKTETDIEQERKLNAVLHRGLREFREGNYFRAIAEFNFALLISPNNGRASFYLNRTRQRLDEEIELNFTKARQEADALKYDAAIVSYCSVIRLLRDYPEDERYIEAVEQIDRIEEKMGYLADEDSCFSRQ